MREDQEARERLKEERVDDEYMAELHRKYQERIEEERRMYEAYKARKTADKADPSNASVIGLRPVSDNESEKFLAELSGSIAISLLALVLNFV